MSTEERDEWHREVDHKLDTMNRQMKLILDAVKGNSFTGEKGIIDRQAEMKERLDKLEKWRDRAIWLFVGGAAPVSWSIMDILKKVFKS